MTKYALLLITALCTLTAHAADAPTAAAPAPDCTLQAEGKKLAGAAKNSFMKKCEREAKASTAGSACDAKAAEKKLAGAAKNSFVKKCVKDAAQ